MDETSRSGLSLVPAESPRLGDNVGEYQLVGDIVGGLQEIFEFLRIGGADGRVIWTTPNAFICSGTSRENIKIPPEFDADENVLWFHAGAKIGSVSIAAATQDDRMDCLEFLLRQPDKFYAIHLRRLSPLTPRICKILLNRMPGTGRYIFDNESFSAGCGRLLGTCGSETHLTFIKQCKFEDGGEAFVNALSQCQDNKLGPSKMSLDPNELFDQEHRHNFLRALQQTSLQHLTVTLISSSMLDDQTSQLISMIKIRMLHLFNVQMVDYGKGLAASISRGQGPRGLHIACWRGSSLEVLIPVLLKALSDERCALEKLIIDGRIPDADILVTALQRNRKLFHFELRERGAMHISQWKQVFRAISNHPTIRSLGLSRMTSSEDDEYALHYEKRKQRTDDVVLMLTTNHVVVDFEFCSCTFDRPKWDDRVTPLLERNRWREKVRYLWKVEPESTRASLLVLCMANVGSSPSIVYQLLSGNQGLIASYTVRVI